MWRRSKFTYSDSERTRQRTAMDAVLLCPRATTRFPVVTASTKKHLRSLGSSIASLKEIAVESPHVGLKKNSQFVVSCVNPNGSKRGRSPRKNSASGRNPEEAKSNTFEPSKRMTNSANQEEIISLFRRIQSSISKGSTEGIKKRNSDEQGDKHGADQSVLEIIRNSRKQTKGKVSLKDLGGFKLTSRSRGDHVEVIPPSENFILTRPRSNFVKRSPIPSPTAPRGKHLHLEDEALLVMTENNESSQLHKLDEMKLPEIKELAKSRGIKGYSKLKKKDLLELLNS